jgi:plastocyanin
MVTTSSHLRFRSAIAASLCLAAISGAPAMAHRDAVTRVTVNMTEYRFRLSVNHARTGTVVFTVINKGKITHTFAIQKLQVVTPIIQPGKRAVLRVTFKKPGKYYYLCTVGAHEQYGMWGNLRVTS